MIINKNNLERNRREVYLHDSEMISMKQCIDDHRLEVIFENHYKDVMKRSVLRFDGIVFFEGTNYLPWNQGCRVDCLFFEEPSLFYRLQKVGQEFGTSFDKNLPPDKSIFIQPVISFVSGDRLRILCEEMEMTVESL